MNWRRGGERPSTKEKGQEKEEKLMKGGGLDVENNEDKSRYSRGIAMQEEERRDQKERQEKSKIHWWRHT